MSKKAIILLIVLAGLIAAAFIIYSSLADDVVPAAPDTGSDDTVKNEDEDLAEDFTVHDLDGNEVSLSDMRGRPVIVNFFATWCGPCMSEMPHLEKVYDEMKDRIVFMAVDLTDGVEETKKDVEKFLGENGYDIPVYLDDMLDTAVKYRVTSIPTTLFIGSGGELKGSATGAMSEELFRNYIKRYLDIE